MSEARDNVHAMPGAEFDPDAFSKVPVAPSGFWPEDATIEAAEYLLDKWIPERATVYLFGRHGSLKSFLLVHLALCGGLSLPVMGYDVPEAFGSIICVGEKKSRFGKRIAAWKLANDVTANAPVYVRDGCPDLTDDDAVAGFIAEVNAMKPQFERRGAPLRLIGLDTLSRALRAGNVSDPDTAQLAINAMQRIIDETGCTVLCTAHVAKAEGSDTIKGAGEFGDSADTYIRLERDKEAGLVTATLGKQSDGPDGLKFAFRFKPVIVGEGKRGDIWSGGIEGADVPEAAKGGRRPDKAEEGARLIMTAYGRAFDEKAVPIRALGAHGAQGVELERLRTWALDRLQFGGPAPLREGDESEKDHAARLRTWRGSRNTAFNRALDRLRDGLRLRVEDGFVWEPSAKAGERG
jgi:hypothetical protein